MIYICSPFTHDDRTIEAFRFTHVSRYAHKLLLAGEIAFSPIVYGYHFHTTYDVPGDSETWRNFNMAMLRNATVVHVYMLPGWEKSKGIAEELLWAHRLSLPVRHIPPVL